jgi:YegS/Rv2252/BmrU family lipid kinase
VPLPRKALIIYNPRADANRALKHIQHLKRKFQAETNLTWVATEHANHAPQLAFQAGVDGFDVVAAMGGDGTVHQVINGLMKSPQDQRPMLGVIPIGSGNDFSVNIGIGKNSELAIGRILTGEPMPIDIGRLEDSFGRSEYWCNTLGIGFDAITVAHTKQFSYLRGSAMYFAAIIQSILRDHIASHMVIQSQEKTFEMDLLMLTVCNGSREGGGFRLIPEARMDDGILDFIMVEYVSRLMMFRLIPEFILARHARFKQIHFGSSTELTVNSERPMVIHMDGEIFSRDASQIHLIRIEVLPGAIDLLV